MDRNALSNVVVLSTGGTIAGRGASTKVTVAGKRNVGIERIDRAGPRINSVIELNPDALKIAEGLDAEVKPLFLGNFGARRGRRPPQPGRAAPPGRSRP